MEDDSHDSDEDNARAGGVLKGGADVDDRGEDASDIYIP